MKKIIPLIVILIGCAIIVAGVAIMLTKDNEDTTPNNVAVTEDEFVELIDAFDSGDYEKVYDRLTPRMKEFLTLDDIKYDWLGSKSKGKMTIDNVTKSEKIVQGVTYTSYSAFCVFDDPEWYETGKAKVTLVFQSTDDCITAIYSSNNYDAEGEGTLKV